jgi:hypothetical protein
MISTPIPRIPHHPQRRGAHLEHRPLEPVGREEDVKPTSGVRNPGSRFAMKMMPRWTG